MSSEVSGILVIRSAASKAQEFESAALSSVRPTCLAWLPAPRHGYPVCPCFMRISLLQGYPHYMDILLIRISILGHYHLEIPIIAISLLGGYPYYRDISSIRMAA